MQPLDGYVALCLVLAIDVYAAPYLKYRTAVVAFCKNKKMVCVIDAFTFAKMQLNDIERHWRPIYLSILTCQRSRN